MVYREDFLLSDEVRELPYQRLVLSMEEYKGSGTLPEGITYYPDLSLLL